MHVVFPKEPFGLRFAGTLLLRFDLVFRLESSLVVVGGLYKFWFFDVSSGLEHVSQGAAIM